MYWLGFAEDTASLVISTNGHQCQRQAYRPCCRPDGASRATACATSVRVEKGGTLSILSFLRRSRWVIIMMAQNLLPDYWFCIIYHIEQNKFSSTLCFASYVIQPFDPRAPGQDRFATILKSGEAVSARRRLSFPVLRASWLLSLSGYFILSVLLLNAWLPLLLVVEHQGLEISALAVDLKLIYQSRPISRL